METVGNILLGVGSLAFLVGIVRLIITFIRSRGRRSPAILTGVAFLLAILGGILAPQTEPAPASKEPVTTATSTPTLTPMPTPTLVPTVDLKKEYASLKSDLALRTSDTLAVLSGHLQSADYDNPMWIRDLRQKANRLVEHYQEALVLLPGPGW